MKGKNLGFRMLLIIAVIILAGCSTESNKVAVDSQGDSAQAVVCLLYTSPSPRD